jgi:hypothetical protein
MKQRMRIALGALAALTIVGAAYASQFARPYSGGGPNDYPASLGNTIQGVYLVDPVSGNPMTPAGTVSGGSGSSPAGISANSSIGTTSAFIVTAGQFPHWLTIKNTHATQTLYVSFNATATTSDFSIAPGASLTIPTGTSNGITAIGSGAGTTYALIGY